MSEYSLVQILDLLSLSSYGWFKTDTLLQGCPE